MNALPARQDPETGHVAVHVPFPKFPDTPWLGTDGARYYDSQVADWTPLGPVPADHGSRTRELKVEVRLVLNRSTTRISPHVAHIEILDTISRMEIMEIHLTADEFHRFMAGRTPGDVDGVVADVAAPRLLARVGMTAERWTRLLPFATDPDRAATWAADLARDLNLDAARARRMRDNVAVSWTRWVDGGLTADEYEDIQRALFASTPPVV